MSTLTETACRFSEEEDRIADGAIANWSAADANNQGKGIQAAFEGHLVPITDLIEHLRARTPLALQYVRYLRTIRAGHSIAQQVRERCTSLIGSAVQTARRLLDTVDNTKTPV